MTTKIKALVLDLDDTLYAEISYLQSAYRFIAAKISTQPQSLIRLWKKPVTIRKDNLNKDLIIKQH